MGLDAKWTELPEVQRRFLLFSVAVAIIFLLLILRLWFLQIVNHEEYLERSIRNRTRVLSLEAPRGPIYDRNGVLLVDNRPSFRISVLRQDVADRTRLLTRLAELLEVDRDVLEQRWQKGRHFPI
ncbi:MAG: penicillin-binding protein 2, partial [Desulfuromonadaceae bacterium]|nr:penicillin-binding protein 2 [Desulfuromonadaceae bacterium]